MIIMASKKLSELFQTSTFTISVQRKICEVISFQGGEGILQFIWWIGSKIL